MTHLRRWDCLARRLKAGQTGKCSAAYPGNEVVFEWAFNERLPYFEPYTGEPYEMSAHYSDTVTPSPESWSEGDHGGLCTIVAVDELLNVRTVSGSAMNSGSQS